MKNRDRSSRVLSVLVQTGLVKKRRPSRPLKRRLAAEQLSDRCVLTATCGDPEICDATTADECTDETYGGADAYTSCLADSYGGEECIPSETICTNEAYGGDTSDENTNTILDFRAAATADVSPPEGMMIWRFVLEVDLPCDYTVHFSGVVDDEVMELIEDTGNQRIYYLLVPNDFSGEVLVTVEPNDSSLLTDSAVFQLM